MTKTTETRYLIVNKYGEEDLLDSDTTEAQAVERARKRNWQDSVDAPYRVVQVTFTDRKELP